MSSPKLTGECWMEKASRLKEHFLTTISNLNKPARIKACHAKRSSKIREFSHVQRNKHASGKQKHRSYGALHSPTDPAQNNDRIEPALHSPADTANRRWHHHGQHCPGRLIPHQAAVATDQSPKDGSTAVVTTDLMAGMAARMAAKAAREDRICISLLHVAPPPLKTEKARSAINL